MHYVYCLKCKDGFYLGCTENLKNRFERHRQGYVPATANRLPVKLDFYLAFSNKYTAFNFEKYLKTGSGRAFLKKHMSVVAYAKATANRRRVGGTVTRWS